MNRIIHTVCIILLTYGEGKLCMKKKYVEKGPKL
jgi:hypothetical protein